MPLKVKSKGETRKYIKEDQDKRKALHISVN